MERLGVADLEDAGAVFFDLFEADSIDLLELGEGAGALEHDAAQGGGAEDEELREAETLGLIFAPVAEALIEKLLLGSEGVGGLGRGGARARVGGAFVDYAGTAGALGGRGGEGGDGVLAGSGGAGRGRLLLGALCGWAQAASTSTAVSAAASALGRWQRP